MDTITHGLIGNLISRTYSKQKENHYWCTFGALFPDVDVVFRLINQDIYLHQHRGFTHSFLGIIFLTLLFLVLYQRFGKHLKPAQATLAFLLGIISHIVFDLITTWHTYLFWPSRISFQLDWVFIVDLIIIGFSITGIVFAKIYQHKALQLSRVFLGLIFIYVGFCGWQHHLALKFAANKKINSVSQTMAFPQPLSPFLWSVFIIEPETIHHSYLHLRQIQSTEWQSLTRQFPEQLRYPEIAPIYQQYLHFARVPFFEWIENEKTTTLVFRDLRFSSKFIEQSGIAQPFVKIVTMDKSGHILSSQWR